MLKRPKCMRLSQHVALVSRIVDLLKIRARAGLRTRIIKTPAHVSSIGNDKADSLANTAAQCPEQCTWTDTSEPNPRKHLYWIAMDTRRPACATAKPASPARDGAAAEPAAACTPTTQAADHMRYAANLQSAVKRWTQPTTGTGLARCDGVYATAIRAALPALDQKHSSHALRAPGLCTHRARIYVLRFLYVVLWNK